jgi:hypothetical protein
MTSSLSLDEMIADQINNIGKSDDLQDFILKHRGNADAVCEALARQIDLHKVGQRQALMALILYYFGQKPYLERIVKLIQGGHLSGFVMDVCQPVVIDDRPLISPQFVQDLIQAALPRFFHAIEQREPSGLDFYLSYYFEEIKPHIAHLRQSNDYRLAYQVITAYRIHSCDEGTLDIIEQYYHQTGRSGFTDVLRHWATYRYEKPLQGYARPIQTDNGHHQKIAQVAFNILNHAFRFADLATNFLVEFKGSAYNPPKRIMVESLLVAIAVCPPQGAIDLVNDMLGCVELHTKYRIEALIYYVDFTGQIPELRKELIEAYFSTDPLKQWHYATSDDATADDIFNFTKRNLVTLQELLVAIRTDQRRYGALRAVWRWPNIQHYRSLIVPEMFAAAEDVLTGAMPTTSGWNFNEYLLQAIGTLADFELTLNEKQSVDALLLRAINNLNVKYAEEPFLVAAINHWRVHFGFLNEIKDPPKMAPSDAMKIHWRQQKITWKVAAQALVDARVIPNLSYLERLESTRNIKGNIPSIGLLHDLLLYDDHEQQKACICMLSQDKDQEYEFEPFEWLISLLRHPEVVIRQISEVEDVRKTYIDLSDMTEYATADPRTYYFECLQQDYKFTYLTWGERSQTPSILRAFNLLLQKLARVERCYEIDSAGVNDSRMFFVADRFKYPEMQQYLRLPSWEVD